MEAENSFTVLENKTIGRNLSLYRKIRGIKAADMAERLGLKESSYTRYERGETAITIDFLQKSSEVLKVDPITLLSVNPSNIIDNAHSPNSVVALNSSNWHTTNEEQTKLMLKLMESVVALLEKGR